MINTLPKLKHYNRLLEINEKKNQSRMNYLYWYCYAQNIFFDGMTGLH